MNQEQLAEGIQKVWKNSQPGDAYTTSPPETQ